MRLNPVLNNLCQYSVTGAPITLLCNGNRHCSGEEKPVMLSKIPAFSCIRVVLAARLPSRAGRYQK
jgi:hypothetical protein